MKATITFNSPVNLSIRDAFVKKYRTFSKYLTSPEGQLLYGIVATEEMLYLAMFFSDELGLPAITASSDRCYKAMKDLGKDIGDQERQFLGALYCSLLEANGYRKKKKPNGEDEKKPVPHRAYRSAQVYERIP